MFLLFIVFVIGVSYAQESPIVNITQGSIQGIKHPDGNYFAFYGIHYAGPVSGDNRFKMAPPPPNYTDVFQAVNDTVICAQPTLDDYIGVEDCLTLNIFTPNITASQPVMVWIEGEEYTRTKPTKGSFKNFMNENIVVVKVNYRLSIFGFLCLRVEEAPGNAGLKDIVQGLKWISNNIAHFGGDPKNVVLFGHGSGANMVDLITLSPLSKGLVNKAIVQSGSALSPTAIAYDPIGYAEMFAAKLGYINKSRKELANLLIKTDIDLISSHLNDFELRNNTVLFAPCIENHLNGSDTFLSDAPINILRSGNYSQIPYVAGYTDKEGTIRAEKVILNQWLEKMNAHFDDFIQVDLDFKTKENKSIVVSSIREHYFGKMAINMKVIDNYTDYHGDTIIFVSMVRGLRERAQTSTADVSLYSFEYKGTYNSDWTFTEIPVTGVKHGGILNYLLNYDLKEVDLSVMKSIMNRYAIFIRTGLTNVPGIVEWRPVKDSVYYLSYSGGEESPNFTTMFEYSLVNPKEETIAFWDDIYSKFYKIPPLPTTSDSAQFLGLSVLLIICQTLTMYL
ncbi:venom carboxylesterase-6-like [Battus philenor]|uniref:venom carboxylesterase-6-like n=1 Tax=Battus philenor TaxID=42288 RepID=UPI0035CF42EB